MNDPVLDLVDELLDQATRPDGTVDHDLWHQLCAEAVSRIRLVPVEDA